MDLIRKIYNHLIRYPRFRRKFRSCGDGVTFLENLRVSGWGQIEVGKDVHFGLDMLILCTRAPVIIGDHVMFGPRVTLITGNHRTDLVGKYMTEVTDDDKRPEDDQPIVFEGDNWVGANATVLKGVRVGRGAMIASGAVVTKDVPPYSCVGGIPARVISERFSEEALARHKEIMMQRERLDPTECKRENG